MTNDKMNRAYETYGTYEAEGILRLRHSLAVVRSSKQASCFAKASEGTSAFSGATGVVGVPGVTRLRPSFETPEASSCAKAMADTTSGKRALVAFRCFDVSQTSLCCCHGFKWFAPDSTISRACQAQREDGALWWVGNAGLLQRHR